jgi:hypothetical protein
MTTGYVTREATHEYFYRDVVSVQTKTESLSVVWRKQAIQLQTAETFTLTTSGGTAIHVVLGDVKLAQLMGGGELPTTEAEQAIQAVRTMLREKKKA